MRLFLWKSSCGAACTHGWLVGTCLGAKYMLQSAYPSPVPVGRRCLCKLLDGIQDHYTYAQPGIQRTVFQTQELVRLVCRRVGAHVRGFAAHPPMSVGLLPSMHRCLPCRHGCGFCLRVMTKSVVTGCPTPAQARGGASGGAP